MASSGPPESRDEVDYVLKVQPPAAVELDCSKSNQNPPTHPTTLDKFNIFALRRRPKSDPGTGIIARHVQQRAVAAAAATTEAAADSAKKKKSRFVKSASIARIFGNNYNTKKYEQDSGALLKLQQLKRSFLGTERFQKKEPKETNATAEQQQQQQNQEEPKIGDGCYVNDSGGGSAGDSGPKAIRSITRGLGRLLRRNCHSIEISRPDPEYKVSYLGNVLTGWAKGK